MLKIRRYDIPRRGWAQHHFVDQEAEVRRASSITKINEPHTSTPCFVFVSVLFFPSTFWRISWYSWLYLVNPLRRPQPSSEAPTLLGGPSPPRRHAQLWQKECERWYSFNKQGEAMLKRNKSPCCTSVHSAAHPSFKTKFKQSSTLTKGQIERAASGFSGTRIYK